MPIILGNVQQEPQQSDKKKRQQILQNLMGLNKV
jgi:hypothetical protein